MNRITRRTFMGSLGAAATMPASGELAARAGPILTRAIPKPARRSRRSGSEPGSP